MTMDLQYTGSHFSSAEEPVRIQVPNGGSPAAHSLSAEDELSSDSSQDKPPRLHIMAGPSTHLGAEEDDEDNDSYGASFPSAEEMSNNGSYCATSAPLAITPVGIRSPVACGHGVSNSTDNVTPPRNSGTGFGVVRYRECLKNHAANIGGHALDGCGEFIPSGIDGSDAFTCSACGCHRNFHLREVDGEPACTCRRYSAVSPNLNLNSRGMSSPSTPGLLSVWGSRDIIPHPQADTSMNSLPYTDDLDLYSGSSCRKKRHRTKFSTDQKERMLDFADKLGWRISKQHDELLQQFCAEVGITRNVFKVWMHNNKSSVVKRMNTGENNSIQRNESESPPEMLVSGEDTNFASEE